MVVSKATTERDEFAGLLDDLGSPRRFAGHGHSTSSTELKQSLVTKRVKRSQDGVCGSRRARTRGLVLAAGVPPGTASPSAIARRIADADLLVQRHRAGGIDSQADGIGHPQPGREWGPASGVGNNPTIAVTDPQLHTGGPAEAHGRSVPTSVCQARDAHACWSGCRRAADTRRTADEAGFPPQVHRLADPIYSVLPSIVATTNTAGRLSTTSSPTRSHAIEFATGQCTPMYGACASTREADSKPT